MQRYLQRTSTACVAAVATPPGITSSSHSSSSYSPTSSSSITPFALPMVKVGGSARSVAILNTKATPTATKDESGTFSRWRQFKRIWFPHHFDNNKNTDATIHTSSSSGITMDTSCGGGEPRPLRIDGPEVMALRQTARAPALDRLRTIITRELYEETLKDELPPKPRLPRGWTLDHQPGAAYFTLTKTVSIVDGGGSGTSGEERMTVIGHLEVKTSDTTYDTATGERTEQQHLVFELFVEKPKAVVVTTDSANNESSDPNEPPFRGGGLEFVLTSVDSELVLDGLAVHSTAAAFTEAKDHPRSLRHSPTERSKRQYRGPYPNELDDAMTDEIFDYLDDRGVNNAFAEFMMAQGYYLEQQEYLRWLTLIRTFAGPVAPKKEKFTAAASTSSSSSEASTTASAAVAGTN